MSDLIRVAVVGVGYLGKIHAKIYAGMDNVELVGVADTDQQAARDIAAELNTRYYTDSHELIDQVDAVSIVVPTSLHESVSRPFLENGVHMLRKNPWHPL